jgi:hypothetical protein
MANDIAKRTALWALAPAGLAALATALAPASGCSKTAEECAALGQPPGCTPGVGTGGLGGTGGTGGSTTGGTGGIATGGHGGTGGTGTGGHGGMGTGGASPADQVPSCNYKEWGDAAAQAVRGVAVDNQGITIAGDFQGQINLGTGPLGAAAGGSMFLARFDSTLGPSWSAKHDAHYQAMAADGAGDVFVAGQLASTYDFGCGALDPATGKFFLLKVDASGNCIFSRNFDVDVVRASIAVLPSGQPVIAGGANGPIAFGTTQPSHGGEDIFVASFSGTTGDPIVVRTYGDANDDEATGISVNANGRVFVAGTFHGKLDLGAGNGTYDAAGLTGAFAVGYTTTLGASWSRQIKGDHDLSVTGIAPLSNGGFAVGGGYQGQVTFSPTLALTNTDGGYFVGWIDASGGVTTVKDVASLAAANVAALATGPNDDLALVGSVTGGLYVGHLDGTGAVTFTGTAAGSGTNHQATSAAFLSAGKLLVGGVFDQSLTVAQATTIDSAGSDDALLLEVCLP